MNNYGTNTDSILYRNFLALKNATHADAVDYDDETLYDAPTAVKFGRMLSSMGYKVTLCPYTNPSFWQSVYNQLGSGIVDAVYLQCYAGGAGNDPGAWNSYFPGLKVIPGMWGIAVDSSGSTASQVQAQMTAWHVADGIPGGFIWLYDNIAANTSGGTPADYAAAINHAVDPLTITPSTGFSGVVAYHLRSLTTSTPFALSNASAGSLSWSLINTSAWLNASVASGTMAAGGTAFTSVSLNTTIATNLAFGTYSASVVFSNKTTGVGLARNFTLNTAVANWPVSLNGFSVAILASNNATPGSPGATAFDIPNNYCFYQQGLSGSTRGLPLNGIFSSQSDSATAFQLGPYGAADALILGDTYPKAGTLAVSSPDAFNSLAILATSANGGGQGTLVLNFADGTKSPVFAFNCQDWFYTVTNVAIQGFGRLKLGSSLTIEDNGDANPNLYQTTINLAALGLARPIASITFSNPASAGTSQTTAIMAVSGMPTSVPLQAPDGLTAIPGTNATVQLFWNASAGATNYHVKLSSVSGSGYVTVGGTTDTSYTATGLANGSTYYFVVSAAGVANESAGSSQVSAMPGSYAGWVFGANPVAYWPLNETSGPIAFELVHGSNGVYAGGYTLATGGAIGAGFGSPHRIVIYNGASGYTQIPRLIGGTNFSIVFWVRTGASGGTPNWYNGEGLVDGEVTGTTGDFGVALVGAKVGFGVGNPDTTLTSIKSISDNQWHQVVATRDAGSGAMKLFIDGKSDNNVTGPTGVRTNPPAMRIGSLQTGANFFNGSISDVALYQQVLTTNQIATLYSAATGLFYNVTLTNKISGANLILSWPGNGKLLEATNLAGPWTTNVSASPVMVTPNQPQKFYRIKTQ
jgi:Concanavalin A-like lectin/glucanases superfamily/Fibronectin type III domain